VIKRFKVDREIMFVAHPKGKWCRDAEVRKLEERLEAALTLLKTVPQFPGTPEGNAWLAKRDGLCRG
jgi:hypothetical protein